MFGLDSSHNDGNWQRRQLLIVSGAAPLQSKDVEQ